MKKKIILLTGFITILFFLSIFFSGCIRWERDDKNTQVRKIMYDGVERSYRIHIPPGFEKGYEGSLLFVLHGGGGTAEGMEKYLTNKTFNRMSDTQGFIVIYPDGYEKHWNDGRRNVSWNNSMDDVGFLSTLIDTTVNEFHLDPHRVFFCGISNGGQMSYRMACEKTDKIAGIASVVSSMSEDLISLCSPTTSIPVFIICGTNDPLVPYDGGEIMLFNKTYGRVVSVNQTVQYWVSHNHCDTIPTIDYLPDKDSTDDVIIRSEEYGNGENDSKVLLYVMKGGGHTWPGGPQYFPERVIGKTCGDIDAGVAIVNFFNITNGDTIFDESIVIDPSATLPLAVSPSSVHPSPTEETLFITLNCTNTKGIIRSYGDINDGPYPITNNSSYADLTEQYKDIGITFIRTHDLFGPTDISTIFPNWSADPTLASSYHFDTSDPLITSMINAGCDIYYRLGESAGQNDTLKTPPADFTKWAEICKHITMHYNDGWDNGFYYQIKYWEVWNEPDLIGFWNGTADQYYKLYQVTAETLKTYNSSLKIGGPCTSSVTNKNYTEGFVQFIQAHHTPLDFYSWHLYATTPSEYYNASLHVRTLLDTYGYTNTENINSEWNYNILSPQRDKDNAKNAAFTACSFTVFQDAQLNYAFRYRGNQENNWLMRFLGLDLSLFTSTGIYKRPALTYKAMNDLTHDTPLRLTTTVMNASTGITYLAGISADKTNISILISNFNANDAAYTIEMTNLPWQTTYRTVQYLIDETHHLEIQENTMQNISPYIHTETLKKNTIHVYRFTNSSIIPKEGSEVAKIPMLLRLRLLDPLTQILTVLLVLFILG